MASVSFAIISVKSFELIFIGDFDSSLDNIGFVYSFSIVCSSNFFLSGLSIYVIESLVKFIDIYYLIARLHFKAEIKESSSRKERKYVDFIHIRKSGFIQRLLHWEYLEAPAFANRQRIVVEFY